MNESLYEEIKAEVDANFARRRKLYRRKLYLVALGGFLICLLVVAIAAALS